MTLTYTAPAAALLALVSFAASAQVPVSQPMSGRWFSNVLEIELRLKGEPAAGKQVKAVNDLPTRRVVRVKFRNYNARYLTYTVPCWNKVSACQSVIAVTYRVMLKLPWSQRLNVTKYVNCQAVECLLAGVFAPLVAKPGEGYSFRYDRVEAVWAPAPNVVALPQ
jgi:hypothetical protein